LKEKVAQFLFADVAEGLAYLHHPKILVPNRDIKPENIVFTTELGGTSVGKRDRALIVDHTTAEEIP
jgi:serine/threonine protein kinase